ncbi:hypothetical protein D3C85_1432270 [compost metagenome]
MFPGTTHDLQQIIQHSIINMHMPNFLLDAGNFVHLSHRLKLIYRLSLLVGVQHGSLGILIGVTHTKLHHETVQLSLGKHISPFKINRILGRA